MELIPSFILFIIAAIWKSEQEAKRHFAERDPSAAPEGRNTVTQNKSAKS